MTDADLCDPEVQHAVSTFVETIESMVEFSGLERGASSELVIELLGDESGIQTCGYYFADTERKTLFWLTDYDAGSMLEEVAGETWPTHIRHELESRFWSHCEMFPNHRDVPKELLQEVLGTLVHGCFDSMTSSYSTFPYGHADARDMIHLLKTIEDVGPCGGRSACVVSRLMIVLTNQKFIHYHGQKGARLAANQSIYGTPAHKKSWHFRLLAPLLFYAPDMHLEGLEKIWVDQVCHYVLWQKSIDRLQLEWENLSLTTTVMLTVDVSFLAIQSVDVGFNQPGLRCAAQIAIYLSTVASVGSIILGLLLTRHHRVIVRDDAEVAQAYLYSKYNAAGGLENLAIMYSLPYALLMWAMVTFLLALSGLCFSVNPTVSVKSSGARIPISIAWIFVLSLIAWFLHTDWDGRHHPMLARIMRWISNLPSTVSKRIPRLASRDDNSSEINHLKTFIEKVLVGRTEVGNTERSQTV
ncbi:hypothetical protein NEOLEDRAFT_1133218 [Neolentinus lepideus HHB14362 ss-1]|uniref:Uncharacterized protein n=1 Tax=Neolentinus lepideus HHB14362 ss-1 TaxID=1314782 RepID=A0A165SUM4_9AGAM|nr:hypothetical protein NEOLEDRAFT_1133218 [Neolentinus lepideus HHB14362 ss-1]